MKAIRYTKDGVVIPSAWMRTWGKPISVQRSADVVILESPARQAARKRLARIIRKLRKSTRDLPTLTPDEIMAEVNEVRRNRARRH